MGLYWLSIGTTKGSVGVIIVEAPEFPEVEITEIGPDGEGKDIPRNRLVTPAELRSKNYKSTFDEASLPSRGG